jgi:hypothetical protein
MNTAGLTGPPSVNMFYRACYNMSGVTGAFPAGFLDMSGLSGTMATNALNSACEGMTGMASGDFNISSNITLTGTNIVGTMPSAWRSMPSWNGQVYFGTAVIHTVMTPVSDQNTFRDSTNMPSYSTINANWK